MHSRQKINLFAEIAGWYGMGAIVLAYMFVSFELLSPGGYAYQLLNLTGAVGVVAISWVKRAHQPLILNLFWAGIAALALLSLLIR